MGEKKFFRPWLKESIYTRHNLTDLLCISVNSFLYDKRFYWTVFPYSYNLGNHSYFANALNYCFRLYLARIFCVNSSVKVLPAQYEGPSTQIFRISLLCTCIISRKKEILNSSTFFSKYFFGPKVIPNYMSS